MFCAFMDLLSRCIIIYEYCFSRVDFKLSENHVVVSSMIWEAILEVPLVNKTYSDWHYMKARVDIEHL